MKFSAKRLSELLDSALISVVVDNGNAAELH